MNKVLKHIEDARYEIEEDKYNKLLDGLTNAKGKASADEQKIERPSKRI